MSEQDCEQLTLFREDSPVSRSVLPGSEEARKMTVTSGRKCLESYKNSSPLGSLVKMCLESSIWHSTRCLLRWKTKATKSKRLLFQLAASTPRTKDTESLLWPTPSTGAALCGGTANFQTLRRFAEMGIITEEERKNLSQGNGGKTNPAFLEWLMGYEEQFTKLIPTVATTDCKTNSLNRYWRPSSQTVHVERERETRIRWPAEELGGVEPLWKDWRPDTGILRVANGIPNRVDRIKCLGNAVVPQQFYPIFRAIAICEMEGDA